MVNKNTHKGNRTMTTRKVYGNCIDKKNFCGDCTYFKCPKYMNYGTFVKQQKECSNRIDRNEVGNQ